MKAIIWTRYGPPDVLMMEDVEKPIPKRDEVLIRVSATSAFAGDCELRRLHVAPSIRPFLRMFIGLLRPKRISILGQEMAGTVEAVGGDVKRFHPGDQVFGISGGMRFGCYAEFVCIPEGAPLVIKPDGLSFKEAAVISVGGSEAVHFIKKAGLRQGQRLLINGAGGSIGTLALQMAKNAGARVTCVDRLEKLQMLRELGADEVIDYAVQDFTEDVETYDVVFDLVGRLRMSKTLRSVKNGGIIVLGNPGLIVPLFNRIHARLTGRRAISNLAPGTANDLELLKGLICERNVRVIIDRTYPLSSTAEAHRYIETGQKKGNVVIMVQEC